MRIRATAIIVFVLAWVSWAYERATGLTFVLSRRYTHLGAISNQAHLTQTLRLAIGASVLCAVALLIGQLLARGEDA
jgi:predicted lysophospholipase L1 biosynthesis ABC-type transport system permease subunit